MILIADSGSTKTDWCLINDESYRKDISTKGMNPYQQSEEQLANEVDTALISQLPTTTIEKVYFYGAGCIYDKILLMKRVLRNKINITKHCEVNSDMLGVARALCGHEAGIACILGTGSNSCFYDGSEITRNVSALGFILGDEGSGAVLGKLFLGDLYKNQFDDAIKEEFEQTYHLDAGKVIDHVYRQPYPNRFLASFAPFIHQHLGNGKVYELVLSTFTAFIRRNVMQYEYQQYPVHFCGSIAWNFREILAEAASAHNITLGQVTKSPLEGLIRYHTVEEQSNVN